MENIQERWFIILTEPQRESSAVAGLVARKFSAFSPSVYKAVAVKDRAGRHLKDENGRKRWKKVEEPMFRGYAFVKFQVGCEMFDRVRAVPGVSAGGFVKRRKKDSKDMEPAPIANIIVDAILAEESRQLSAYQAAQKTGVDKLKMPFVAGGPAKIDGGPFDEWVGRMKSLDKAGRVTLLMEMLGGDVEVTIDASQLVPA